MGCQCPLGVLPPYCHFLAEEEGTVRRSAEQVDQVHGMAGGEVADQGTTGEQSEHRRAHRLSRDQRTEGR